MLRLGALAATMATAAAQSAGNWTIIAPSVGTIATGISFNNATHGYLPVAANGVGCEIFHTKNAGKKWEKAQAEPFALLLLDIASYGSAVNVIGALTIEYSINNG
jgi:hypothetical protein